jgi:hypothetical protein
LLVDPPQCDDLVDMATFEAKYSSSSPFRGLNAMQVKDMVEKRFSLIGPKTRNIFKSENEYIWIWDISN